MYAELCETVGCDHLWWQPVQPTVFVADSKIEAVMQRTLRSESWMTKGRRQLQSIPQSFWANKLVRLDEVHLEIAVHCQFSARLDAIWTPNWRERIAPSPIRSRARNILRCFRHVQWHPVRKLPWMSYQPLQPPLHCCHPSRPLYSLAYAFRAHSWLPLCTWLRITR